MNTIEPVSLKELKTPDYASLIKRRIRESYRKQKHLLDGTGTDILFIYSGKEIMDYAGIYSGIGTIIRKINGNERR